MHEDDELSQAVGPEPVYPDHLIAQEQLRQEEPLLLQNESKSSSNETGNLVDKVLQEGSVTSSEKNFQFNKDMEYSPVNIRESPAVANAVAKKDTLQ